MQVCVTVKSIKNRYKANRKKISSSLSGQIPHIQNNNILLLEWANSFCVWQWTPKESMDTYIANTHMLHKRLKGYTILMNLFLARLKNINHKDQAGSECCNKSLGSKGYFQGNKKQAWHNHDLSIYQVAKNNDHSPIIWRLSERLKYSATTPTNSGTTDLYIPQLTSWNTVFRARNFLCIRYLSAIYSIHVSYQNHPLKSLTC